MSEKIKIINIDALLLKTLYFFKSNDITQPQVTNYGNAHIVNLHKFNKESIF